MRPLLRRWTAVVCAAFCGSLCGSCADVDQDRAPIRLVWDGAGADVPSSLRERAGARSGWAAALDRDAGLRAGGGWRRGRVAATGRPLEARVVLPAGGPARLGFSHAFDGPGAALRVDVRPAGAPPEAARELARIEPGRGTAWRWTELELPGPPGAERIVRVSAVGAPTLIAVAEATVHAPLAAPPTVVLITSDTHRGDHVELGVDPSVGVDVHTPALRALAERGLVFTDAFASTNITLPSHAALMTGLHPKDTTVLDNGTDLAERAVTLAERFAAAGWTTYGAVSVALLDPATSGLGQGFDRFSSPTSDRPEDRGRTRRFADETIARLESWWPDAAGRPLFVWLHVFDAHSPYGAPDEFLAPYWPPERDPADPSLPEPPPARLPDWAAGVRDLDYLRARYRAGASWVDHGLARVLALERVQGGVVAVTSDHGENLGDHDIWWTHKDVYRDTLHVPLVLAGPGVPAGRVATQPVRMIDLGRTLLDLAGLDAALHPGRDLVAIAAGAAAAPRTRFALAGRARSAAITDDGWHLVKKLVDHRLGQRGRAVRAGEVELFDLRADPAGLVDVAAREPERRAELEARLDAWLAVSGRGLAGATRDDAETLRVLSELGYVEGDE